MSWFVSRCGSGRTQIRQERSRRALALRSKDLIVNEYKEEERMITVSEMAQKKIGELLQEEKDAIGLRVYVKGGGCHGYQYGMSFETKTADDDTIVEAGGVKVIMDSQSAPLLSGSEVDYVDSIQGSGFAIKNPQAKTTCGCGSSFSA